ncbi:hypothetical protein MRX96_005929 [Rhipicephalus microplus]
MFATACLAAFAVLLYSLYRWRKRTLSVFKELGIPGPEPNLIFGNLLEIWKEGMGPCSSKWLKQYGDVVGYYNGAMPGIVTRDRELIKRIFINDFQYFTGRQIMALVSKNLPVNEVRLSRVSGDDWRYLKNVLIPAFKTNNIKKAFSVMHGCTEELSRVMDSKISGSDGCVERDNEAAQALCKAARQSVGQFGSAALLLLNLLPDSPLMHKLLVKFRSYFTQLPSDEMLDRMVPIINLRRANPEAGNLSRTLTQHPLELITSSNTCIFIIAGIDTIASSLAFATYLLSEHQEVQDKVRAEVKAQLEKEGKLTYDNLSELTYLHQALFESSRLYPSLPGSVRRICDQDYEYNGIPANKANIHPMSYLPYGFGPRKCIASALSQVVIALTVALLVTKYRLLPSGKYKDKPPTYTAKTLLGLPTEGIWLKLQKL